MLIRAGDTNDERCGSRHAPGRGLLCRIPDVWRTERHRWHLRYADGATATYCTPQTTTRLQRLSRSSLSACISAADTAAADFNGLSNATKPYNRKWVPEKLIRIVAATSLLFTFTGAGQYTTTITTSDVRFYRTSDSTLPLTLTYL